MNPAACCTSTPAIDVRQLQNVQPEFVQDADAFAILFQATSALPFLNLSQAEAACPAIPRVALPDRQITSSATCMQI
jgi:hypothetical protein